jgi:Flp pilus assembly protein CpaB
MGTSFAPPTNASPAPDAGNQTTATLEVTPAQANLLALADINSILRLVLRSPDEAVTSLPPDSISFAVPAAPAVAAAAPARNSGTPPAAVRPPVARGPSGPTIIDGDKVVGADPR